MRSASLLALLVATALNPYMEWLGAAWQELDRCAGRPWSTPK